MPVSTITAAYHITPVVIKTFLDHYKRKGKKLKDWSYETDATDDIFFDQGFHIVKAFLNMATHNTVESLQAFANTHVPSPWWAATSPVRIPLSCANDAADIIIDWFGPEELKVVVGGERWWQVRGLNGIDAEWITQREFLRNDIDLPQGENQLSETDADILRMDHLEPVMFYVHGGGYYFGSINTHRYQILRYARKLKSRAFAVNYRKSPQYPFPCAIQDVLAAYLYMIRPPPGALHSAIDPSKIVFAGDSAGGGLCVNVLALLRDMSLPMPAGAVLISPWVDLTHSFPSVMQNTKTDIIPPHGFMAKPSTLWPIESVPKPGEERVGPATSAPPPMPGHADKLKPDSERLENQQSSHDEGRCEGELPPSEIKMQKEMLRNGSGAHDETNSGKPFSTSRDALADSREHVECSELADIDRWEPKPPKVLMEDPNATPLQLQAQIQLYATNEQLTHPLCSPILQGSLGGLCPLYIIAGEGEALRDEITYLAHRAARPEEYPARKGALQDSKRQRENVERFKTPTKVHFQIFDDMCHVLTVFTYTASAKYAYRSIAEFVQQVTSNPEMPFPELQLPREPIPEGGLKEAIKDKAHAAKGPVEALKPPALRSDADSSHSDVERFRSNADATLSQVQDGNVDTLPQAGNESLPDRQQGTPLENAPQETHIPHPSFLRMDSSSSSLPQIPGTNAAAERNIGDFSKVSFIRERIDILGRVRPMEPAKEIPGLQLKPSEIGVIKEAPVRRWLGGQAEWDRLYKHTAERAAVKRKKCVAQAEAMLRSARERGLIHADDSQLGTGNHPESKRPGHQRQASVGSTRSNAEIQPDRRWGPLDLEGERVPPSAICNRRDTHEALALLKKSIYFTAPVTHNTIPTFNKVTLVKAALNPKDRVNHPPQQSASEEQQSKQPMHGMRIWTGLVSYFQNHSSMENLERGLEKGKHKAADGRHKFNGTISNNTRRDVSGRRELARSP